MELSTDRLRLTPVVAENWRDYWPILAAPETSAFSDMPSGVSEKKARAFVDRLVGLAARGRGKAWMIRRGDALIGRIRLNKIEKRRRWCRLGTSWAGNTGVKG